MGDDFDRRYWDDVWNGDDGRAAAMASAAPNPHLIREVAALTPGTALDAGCGAGAEAVWLASRGWRVTGVDISAAALGRAAERAAVAGVEDLLAWVEADLCDWDPGTRFDLVATHYAHASVPQLDLYLRLARLVAPGGTLLIVGHGHHGGHGHAHHREGDSAGRHGDTVHDGPIPHGCSGHGPSGSPAGPPAGATSTAVAISALFDPPGWEIVTAEECSRRVPGSGGGSAVIHDVVVRAVRER